MLEIMRQLLKRWLGINEKIETDLNTPVENTQKMDESLSAQLEEYLKDKYLFRYNVLTEQAEICLKGENVYRPVNQRVANTLCLDAHDHGIHCWDKDITRLLQSERLDDYHPFIDYMKNLPEWDGVDRVTPLALRVSSAEHWVNGFHKWLLGMAAQWSGRMGRCANAVAPLLVSTRQGMGKSTFCKLLIPESLADYYTDSFDLNSVSGCEQKLSLFGLINLDEYDKLSSKKLPLLKNLMQMTSLHFRKAHKAQYSHLPRIASFIGTSNRCELLNDPTGSRRYLCIKLDTKIDCSPLEHKQVFAQLKSELDAGHRYWFTSDEEEVLMNHNRPYYTYPPTHDVFYRCYRLPKEDESYELCSSGDLFTHLANTYPKEMRGMNLNRFGRMLVSLGAERIHTVKGSMYKVVMVA